MTLHLSNEDEFALDVLVQAWGVDREEAVLRAVRQAAMHHEDQLRVARASEQNRRRYGTLLGRLGE